MLLRKFLLKLLLAGNGFEIRCFFLLRKGHGKAHKSLFSGDKLSMTFCLSNQLLQTSSSKLPLWDLVLGTEFGQNISRKVY